MKQNILKIQIQKNLHDVFLFCITPPNSTKWIPSIIKEETNEWPIKVGTIYKLTSSTGRISEVTVAQLKINEYIEWISNDLNYHCKYSFHQIDEDTTELEYCERTSRGEIEGPFTQETLDKLKLAIEGSL